MSKSKFAPPRRDRNPQPENTAHSVPFRCPPTASTALENPNGVGLVICPGGGFRDVWIDREGHDLAIWLKDHNVTSLVLKYRTRPADLSSAERMAELPTHRPGRRQAGDSRSSRKALGAWPGARQDRHLRVLGRRPPGDKLFASSRAQAAGNRSQRNAGLRRFVLSRYSRGSQPAHRKPHGPRGRHAGASARCSS